jgi:fermentation-respiration switch protein FrsA (DUF1100 family)
MDRRMLLPAAGIFLAVLVALALGLRASEERLIYFPQKALDSRPSDWGLSSEDLSVTSADGVRLAGWWIRGRGRAVLVYFHGNAGNVSHRLGRVRDVVRALGLDVVLVDYRGYGESAGRPSEKGLFADGDAIFRTVAARVPQERIALFGESLGCAVALETALRHPCGAVILEAPFLSIPEMARHVLPFFPAFLIRTRFDNASRIARLSVPKLVVQAGRDEVVPPEQTARLYEIAAPPKEFHVIPGARHNDAAEVGGPETLDVWRRFLERSRVLEGARS